jgi:sugar phosphate isomerase/epimerase
MTDIEKIREIGDEMFRKGVLVTNSVDMIHDMASFASACFTILDERKRVMELATALEQMMNCAGGEPHKSDEHDYNEYTDEECEDFDREARKFWTHCSKLLKDVSERTGVPFDFTGSFLIEGDETVEDKLDEGTDEETA